MKRTTSLNNVAGLWVDAVPGVSGGTLIGASDLNTFQEELANAVSLAGGLALDGANTHQLSDVLFRIQCADQIRCVSDFQFFDNILSGPVHDVAAGGGFQGALHVAVGDSGAWSVSKDVMRTWTTPAAAGAEDFRSVCWHPGTGGNKFVVVGDNNTIYQSNTGVSAWTSRASALAAGMDLNAVLSLASGRIVCVGANIGAGTAGIQTSDDGVTWTSRTVPVGAPVGLFQLATDGTTIVAIGGRGTAGTVLKSTDGAATWTEAVSMGVNGLFQGICWHAATSKWYLSDQTHIWSSPDLTTWTNIAISAGGGGDIGFLRLIALPNIVACERQVGTSKGSMGFVSNDGVTWRDTAINGDGVSHLHAVLQLYYGYTHTMAVLTTGTGGIYRSGWTTQL